MRFKFKLLDGGHIGIFIAMPFGKIPVLMFEDWERRRAGKAQALAEAKAKAPEQLKLGV